MKQTYTVQNLLGIHVKPSKVIAQEAASFECQIQLIHKEKTADAKKMIDLLKLGLKCGDEVTLVTSGPREAEAQKVIGGLLEQKL